MVKLFALAAFALIPPNAFDCVVAIEGNVPVIVNGLPVLENGTARRQWVPIASGFLYGDPTGKKDDKGKKLYSVYLVTNRHVFQGQTELGMRFNPRESKPAKEYSVPLLDAKGQQAWFAPLDPQTPPDSQKDVAVVGIDMQVLIRDGIKADFITGDDNAADVAQMRDLGVSEGDGVFVLGFPLQLVGGERNFVIARQGIIARISDLLEGFTKSFLLDTFIFPGNSGGPVILKPEINSINGTKNIPSAKLIGLVTSFQTYQDVAVSQQTGRPRIIFEENAGLANVVPVDQINAAIAEAVKAGKAK
jgi:S1-C subfamily serine protease